MKRTIIFMAFISLISTVSSIFWSKTGGNPYGTSISNVRPDYPYNNYGYGYGYQGFQSVYSRPFNVFGTGSPSSYSYPYNSGYYGSSGFSNPLYSQSLNQMSSNPFRLSSGYNYQNYQNPYYSKPYSFYPSGTAYSS